MKDLKQKTNGWKEAVSILHFNERTETYKKLTVQVNEEDGGVMLVLSDGKKGDKEQSQRVAFSLSRQELIYLAKELEFLFLKGKGGKA